MDKYNYQDAVKSDILDYLKEHEIGYIDDDLRQKLEDDMFVSDSVTGNGSGSYTFNTWTAEENICHNLDLIYEAIDAFGIETENLKKGAEYWDVTIRCYLLNQVFNDLIEEWNENHPEDSDDEDND